ncbi:transcriptional activator protein anr [Sulfurimicrobium lacus]|uniref:Transcriptional activator protein anr n=1 Tax=Sulfurimicrobium lacus TaxID=2715678 RepID=A0A6F8V6U9_9PROT|nr:fumarate/nitrate reduction transcriptional regulator Fnr [Sulfurimicrobium lacus]BCB25418.1 transcriptional activator protein anr [Sulfurimicrobium lacus]
MITTTAVVTSTKPVKRVKVAETACAPIACKDCGIYQLCLTVGGDVDLSLLDSLVKNRRTYKRGELIYRIGEPYRAAFAIRSGAVKTSVLTDDGRVQVTGFHIPGEVLGLNAIINDRYNCEARALETTCVCEVPFDHYEELAHGIPGLQHQMLKIMSQEIVHNQEMMLLLGKKKAEERLATFLVNLSRRLERHGRPALEFKLSMSRSDIGNYLGLAEETVCRVITRFEESSLISTERRLVRLGQMDRLQAMAAGRSSLE